MYTLRPYQTDAVKAALAHFRQSRDPAVIVLPTGAGKSLIIAELARIARGRVLALAHVKELVEQNYQKFANYGQAFGSGTGAGIYSAGLERKDHDNKVIFGSIQSVARAPAEFFKDFSLLIIDECHRVSDEGTQYLEVITALMKSHPEICILGLTATPYRLGMGWIYQYHVQGMIRTEEERFFKKCIYEVNLGYMIKHGFLTPPVKIDSPVASYDFSELFDKLSGYGVNDIEDILKDQKRVTPAIVDNILEISKDRRGVMLFTSTVRHAKEVLGYLPKNRSAIILGDTPPEERDTLINAFKNQQLKYLVNVSVLTTGFDAPHVDVIAILRPTESVSLYQQIIGRGLRLYPDKQDCLILDYTGMGHKIFRPEIGYNKPCKEAEVVDVPCPACGHHNEFWGIADQDGHVLEHFGNKCRGAVETFGAGVTGCGYRFRFTNCEICGGENDLNARTCNLCNNTIKDTKTKLQEARNAKDAHVMKPDTMMMKISLDKKHRERLEISYYDLDGNPLKEYFYLTTENDHKVFYYNFIRMHHKRPELKLKINDLQDALNARPYLRKPLYLIARKQGKFWQIREKIFI